MKKRIIILAAVIVAVIAGASGAWYYAAGQIRNEIQLLGFADGETSPQLTCATLDVRGFPFAFDVDCADAVVVSGDMMIEVPGLRASVMVYDFKHLLASALGPAQLSDAFTGQRWSLGWSKLDASLRLVDSRIARLSIVGDNMNWSDLLLGDTLLASTPHAELHLLDMPEVYDPATQLSALALFARADALDLPMATLSQTAIEVEAELTGVPADYSTIGLTPILPAWQQAGGALNIVALRMNDVGADLSASGNVALDDQGFLNGSIAVDSKGVAERIGTMIEEPWRTLVLGVPGDDGRHTNQINFRNGALSSGLVPLTTLPPLF